MFRFILVFVLPFIAIFYDLGKENNNDTFLICFFISGVVVLGLLIFLEIFWRNKIYNLFFDKLYQKLSNIEDKIVFYIILCTEITLYSSPYVSRILFELEKNLSEDNLQLIKTFSDIGHEDITKLKYGYTEKFRQYINVHKYEAEMADELVVPLLNKLYYRKLFLFLGVFIYWLIVAILFFFLK